MRQQSVGAVIGVGGHTAGGGQYVLLEKSGTLFGTPAGRGGAYSMGEVYWNSI